MHRRMNETHTKANGIGQEGTHFFDVTYWPEFAPLMQKRQAVTYPDTLTQGASVRALTAKLSSANIQSNLQTFSNYNNR